MAKGVHFADAAIPAGLRVYAIGDVHGRLDLLIKMHEAIATELARDRPGDWRILHLGDYVDRGPGSRGVLGLLAEKTRLDARWLALAGNHDIGFLDFLAAPDPHGLFAQFGGVDTARSYGVELDLCDPVAFALGHAALLQAVEERHVAFLSGLEFSATIGDFFFCHAGIKPGVALECQQQRDLCWIRGEFHNHAELYPKVVVHGHTPVKAPQILANRVNVDTGAFATGVLTALVIEGVEKRILQVSEEAAW